MRSRGQIRNEVSESIERVRAYIAVGDISSARLVLRRASDSQDPRAALELGGTYDPVMLKRLNSNFINFYADPAQARDWYKKAADLGSIDAVQRLKALTASDR